MFKKIPGTKEYRINLNCEIIDLDGNPTEIRDLGKGMVEIAIFGILKKVQLKWLALLSWYECGSIEQLSEIIDKIRFYPADRFLKVRCGSIMQFTEPVYYKDGFRIIPGYPRYAINATGCIIDTLENVYVSADYEQHGYLHAYIRTPDHNANRYIRLHRLLALAWLPNTDFINKPIINHIDAIRSNNELVNLEWCSYSENSKHAVVIGNHNSSVGMKTRDVYTGVVEVYNSVTDLYKKLGLSRGYSSLSFQDRLPGFLYKNRYEVKKIDDLTPWYYESNTYNPDKPKKQHFSIRVLNKETGELKTFTNVREFYKTYRIWGTHNLDAGVLEFRKKFKGYEIDYVRNVLSGPYRIIDLETRKIVIVKSIREASEFIGIGENELNLDLRRGYKFVYSKKWVVSTGSDEINVKEYREKPKPYSSIEIVNTTDGSVVVVNSIRAAYRLTGIMPRTIDVKLKNGEPVKCFRFRPLEQ